MRKLLAILFAIAALSLTGVPASAHHSFAAEFDATRPIKLRGTVTKVQLINPHTWLFIDVKGPDGNVVNWAIEGGTPNSLFRKGITKNSLPIGTEIVVDGYQARDGTKKANGRDITFPDGRKVFFSGSDPGAPDDKR